MTICVDSAVYVNTSIGCDLCKYLQKAAINLYLLLATFDLGTKFFTLTLLDFWFQALTRTLQRAAHHICLSKVPLATGHPMFVLD